VTFTEHVPFESLQDELENLAGWLLDQVTLPVGTEPERRTFALQVAADPTTTELWLHDMLSAELIVLAVDAFTITIPTIQG
jgi:hypothetical protein